MIIPVKITTESPLHLGSGKANVVVDADVVHDEYGMPYLPAKRFKGVLYESALEVVEMMEQCGREELAQRNILDKLFGREGANSQVIVHDLHLPDYGAQCDSWKYLQKEYSNIIAAEDVLEEYSELRYQTKIDSNGIAAKGSLHNMRVINAKVTFCGEVELLQEDADTQLLLALALKNLRYIGGKRNRGFGKIACQLSDEQKQLIEKAL